MKARIIEVERDEIGFGIYHRLLWSSVPVDQLSDEDAKEFFDRWDQMWPEREAIPSLLMKKIHRDMKERPNHFFKSIAFPPEFENVVGKDPSKN